MLYIDLAMSREDLLSEFQRKLPRFLKYVIYSFKKISGQVFQQFIENKHIVVVPKISSRTLKKIDKIVKLDVTHNICICDELMKNEEFMEFVQSRKLNLMDGRWLFKYMAEDLIEFVCQKQGLVSENQEISILTNENDSFVFETIRKISKRVKNINVVTKEVKKFKEIENRIYSEEGLILNVTNNVRKSLLKSNIILNMDFSQKQIDKVNFPSDATVIHFKEPIKIHKKDFTGYNIDFFYINLPSKYKNIYSKLTHFDSANLYESLIYKNTLHENIWNEIAEDKVEILSLESNGETIKIKATISV